MAPKYQPVTAAEARLVQGPRPGSRALSDVVLFRMAHRGVRTGGIYNSRKVRGSLTSWSTHAAGRGIDWMVPDKATGDEWLEALTDDEGARARTAFAFADGRILWLVLAENRAAVAGVAKLLK